MNLENVTSYHCKLQNHQLVQINVHALLDFMRWIKIIFPNILEDQNSIIKVMNHDCAT